MNLTNHKKRLAFTLVEVVIAMGIMAMALTSSAVCLRLGMVGYHTARSTSFAIQVLQNEAEYLRLSSWESIEGLPSSGGFGQANSRDGKYVFTRQVSNFGDLSDIKKIWLIAEWSGLKDEMHEIKLCMKYAKNGTYDYYYGSDT